MIFVIVSVSVHGTPPPKIEQEGLRKLVYPHQLYLVYTLQAVQNIVCMAFFHSVFQISGF